MHMNIQGNQLHGIGKYDEAAEKYLRVSFLWIILRVCIFDGFQAFVQFSLESGGLHIATVQLLVKPLTQIHC